MDEKNILIINHFSVNKGNHTLLKTVLCMLRKKGDKYNITVSSYDPVFTQKHDKVDSVGWPLDINRIKTQPNIIFKILMGIYILLRGFLICLSPGLFLNKRFLEKVKSADLVISSGGHLFTSLNRVIGIYSYYLSIRVAHKYNKKIIGLSQSVGPFEGTLKFIPKILSKKAIQMMDTIILRDTYSIEEVNRMSISEGKYVHASEIVYLFPSLVGTLNEEENDENLVGITIHHLYYKYHMSQEKYIQIVSGFINKVLDSRKDMKVIMIPMEFSIEGPKDRKMIDDIIHRIDKKTRISIVEKDLSSEELITLFSKLKVFVGTKTHSIAMGLSSGVPTLSVSYHEKSNYFMEEWGQRKYAIDLKDIDENALFQLFIGLFENSETVKKELVMTRKRMRKKAEVNFDLIEKHLEGE